MRGNMKGAILSLIALMLMLPLEVVGQESEERPWTLDFTTSFYSDYMWRGFNWYDGTSIQPSLAGTYDFGDLGTTGLSLWSHLSSEGDRKEEAYTEVDYTITHTFTFDPVSVTLGHAWYTYPRDKYQLNNASNEFFLVLGVDTFLAPSLSFYQDYKFYDTQYYELNFSQDTPLPFLGEGAIMTPFLSIGFVGNGQKLYKEDGLVQATAGLAFDAKVGELTVQPSFNYTFAIDENTVNEFWIGTKLGYSF